MKQFIVFIMFLILAMAIMPCDAGSDSCNDEKTELTKKNSPDKPENCNAFCKCSRCPFSVLLPVKTLAIRPVPLNNGYSFQSIPALSDVSLSIWQPPKLG